MIDPAKLKDLVKLMVDNDLTELDLKYGTETVTIKRGGHGAPVMHTAPVMAMPAMSAAPAAAPAPAAVDPGLKAVESPMVGTFYSAANPDTPPFVKPGSKVTGDSVVCLIEAMKVFNEIKADLSGTVEQVLVKNGQAVEFGQKLFLVRPS